MKDALRLEGRGVAAGHRVNPVPAAPVLARWQPRQTPHQLSSLMTCKIGIKRRILPRKQMMKMKGK
jgi:hypothetical protein